jgi:hypothetical protein
LYRLCPLLSLGDRCLHCSYDLTICRRPLSRRHAGGNKCTKNGILVVLLTLSADNHTDICPVK